MKLRVFGQILIVILVASSTLTVYGQSDRLKPGRMYDQGEEITASRVGIRSVIPQGWAGMLPQGSEVFLLMPQSGGSGEIYVVANKESIESILARSEDGIEIVEGVTARRKNELGRRGSVLYGELEFVPARQAKAYSEIKCGDFGYCIISLLVHRSGDYNEMKRAVSQFNDEIEFFEPKEMEDYADLDWAEFLGNKYLTSFRFTNASGKQNEIWLCDDGTFTSKIKRKGSLKKEDKELQGRKKGTWRAEGQGATGTLFFKTKKSETEIPVQLTIREDKVYSASTGERIFVMENFQCN